jgi:hypothetical protein
MPCKAKGFLPVLMDSERQAAVLGCRFVDEPLGSLGRANDI